MIGQETIDRVRQQTGIVAVIGETVKLSKRGRSHIGLCPFHKEKTPSFHVNEERGFYHCFGCGVSGDVFRFVQETQGQNFIEAVKSLAERAGIEIADDASDLDRRQQAEARRRQQELYDLNNAAATFFERMLREHPLAAHARSELERRGLVPTSPTDSIANALQGFRIGYAPYGWDGLAAHLRYLGMSMHAAEKVGLVLARRSGGGHYDRFRHRLMFAVVDVQGRVIAFSGRMLADPEPQELATLGIAALPASEGAGKYVNSPETAIYRKREAVFGLYQAKDAIRTSDRCVLVEGNFDVVSLHARGICNVVAPLGTAFTTEQARQIKRFAPEVVLLFDGDNAGRRAAASSRESCREAGLSARVAELPEGVDPDELVRQAGPEALSRVLKNAKGMLEYMIGVALEGSFAGADARSQAERIKRVADLLASEDDPAVRALAEQHADAVASRLGITDAATFRTLARAVQRGLSNGSAQQNVGPAEQAAQPPGRARSRDRHDEISLGILGAILDYPELLDTPEVQDGVQLIEGDVAAAIAAVRQAHQAGLMGHAEQVLAKLAPSIHSFAAARLAAPRHVKVEDATTELLGNVEKLKRLALKRQRSAVIEDLERAAQVGDFDREMLLLREHMRRARERHGLGER